MFRVYIKTMPFDNPKQYFATEEYSYDEDGEFISFTTLDKEYYEIPWVNILYVKRLTND